MIRDVFATLDGVYGTHWVVRALDPSTGTLTAMASDDRLEYGRGYWVSSNGADQQIVIDAADAVEQDTQQRFLIDLEEPASFEPDFLTLVFPHPEWGRSYSAYTTDFRAVAERPSQTVWHIEVRSGGLELPVPVTITWEGPEHILMASRLESISNPPGETPPGIRTLPGGAFTVQIKGGVHHLRWITNTPAGVTDLPRLPTGRGGP